METGFQFFLSQADRYKHLSMSWPRYITPYPENPFQDPNGSSVQESDDVLVAIPWAIWGYFQAGW